MADRMRKKLPTIGQASLVRGRDAVDAARLKLQGDPSHINAREDRLLRETMPEAHGRVVTRGLLAEAGRRGDDRVTLLTGREAALLKARGGAGTVNPASGLLEYNNSGDQDDGDPGNTSNAGENTGGMSGAPGSGVAGPEGPGTGRGDGPGDHGNYASGAYGYGYDAYNGRPSMPSVESLLAAPNFAMPGVSFERYDPRDSWGRLYQEYMTPHPAAMRATPGRYGMPTGMGPGIMGTAVSMLSGNPMGMAMGIGAAMGRAQSPEQQAASMAHNQAQGAKNSTGQDNDRYDLTEAAVARRAGLDSGAATAELPQAPPGYTINPAGQIVPMAGADRERSGVADPVRNLLYDYIWRGRVGGAGW